MIGWMLAMSLGQADPDSVQAVIGAERAFAAEAGKSGVAASFTQYAAPEGVVLRPDPVPVAKSFAARPPSPSAPTLDWWPQWAGVARSGDLGFTTGPFTVGGEKGGYYFTVWKKQPDGARRGHYVRMWQNRSVGWRIVFDELLPVPAAQTGTCPGPAARRAPLPPIRRGVG
jgi:hypothetical protein